MPEGLELLLLVFAVAFAVLSVETKNLTRSVFGLLLFTATVGVIFILVGAVHVGALQIIVYSGGVTALFLVMIMLTSRRDET
ncbi:MAG: NADH-quinone oxidoreductase subunit J [Nitrososphaerota archaeon]